MNGNIIRRRQSQEVEPFRLASKSIVVRPVQASRRVGKVVENDDRVLGNRLESTADGPNNPTADGPNNPTADGKTLKETKKAKRAKGNQKSFTTAIYLFNGVNPKIVDKFGEKLEYKGDTFRLVDVKNFKEKTFKVLQLSENHDAIQLSENHDAKDLIMTEEEVLDMIEQPASSTFTRTGTTPEMRALATKAKIKTDEESKTENQVTNLIAKSKKKSISGESMVIKPLKVVSNSKYYWDEVLNPTKGVAHKYFFNSDDRVKDENESVPYSEVRNYLLNFVKRFTDKLPQVRVLLTNFNNKVADSDITVKDFFFNYIRQNKSIALDRTYGSYKPPRVCDDDGDRDTFVDMEKPDLNEKEIKFAETLASNSHSDEAVLELLFFYGLRNYLARKYEGWKEEKSLCRAISWKKDGNVLRRMWKKVSISTTVTNLVTLSVYRN